MTVSRSMVRVAAAFAMCAALPALGQETAAPAGQAAAPPASSGQIQMQLNNAQSVEDGCRLTFAVRNDTGEAVERSTYVMAVLDGQGQVTSLISFGFQNFPVGRTRFEQFKVEGQACDDISGWSINDVAECVSAGGAESPMCEQSTVATTKTAIQFPWELQ